MKAARIVIDIPLNDLGITMPEQMEEAVRLRAIGLTDNKVLLQATTEDGESLIIPSLAEVVAVNVIDKAEQE